MLILLADCTPVGQSRSCVDLLVTARSPKIRELMINFFTN
jgi:hypothetical protein